MNAESHSKIRNILNDIDGKTTVFHANKLEENIINAYIRYIMSMMRENPVVVASIGIARNFNSTTLYVDVAEQFRRPHSQRDKTRSMRFGHFIKLVDLKNHDINYMLHKGDIG